MNGTGAKPSARDKEVWTTEQVLAWMDSFRALILETKVAASPYERIRENDPMRRAIQLADIP